MLRDYRHPVERRRSLRALLRVAVRDDYARQAKTSRDYPRKKSADPPAGLPRLRRANPPSENSAQATHQRVNGAKCHGRDAATICTSRLTWNREAMLGGFRRLARTKRKRAVA